MNVVVFALYVKFAVPTSQLFYLGLYSSILRLSYISLVPVRRDVLLLQGHPRSSLMKFVI